MRDTALILSAIIVTVAITFSRVDVATAEDRVEQSAEQTQTFKTECNDGAYGQPTICKTEGSQTQKLHQLITYAKVLGASKIHTPVDTAIDAKMMFAVLATGLTGIGAFFCYTRLG